MTVPDISPETIPHAELDSVTINQALPDLFDGHLIPAGSTGTIVAVDQPGVCYTIEFIHPRAALVSAMHDQIL